MRGLRTAKEGQAKSRKGRLEKGVHELSKKLKKYAEELLPTLLVSGTRKD
jgi:hypothetical protein